MAEIALTQGMRANVLTLQKTAGLFDKTQGRLSTGKAVNTALDDPVKFFAAQAHSSRATFLMGLKSEMQESIQTIKAADNGVTAMGKMLDSAKGLLQSMKSGTSLQKSSLATQFVEVFRQMAGLVGDAKYKGTNLLSGEELDVQFNERGTTFGLGGTGFTVYVGSDGDITATLDQLTLGQLSATGASVAFFAGFCGAGAALTGATVQTAINMIDKMKRGLESMATKLSTNLSIVQTRQDFGDLMVTTLNTGADQLTLADMNEEGANMLMLQTRQSLSTTALSLASQAAQSVLRLF